MEENQTTQSNDSKLYIFVISAVIVCFVIGGSLGYVIAMLSVQGAFNAGEVRLCTGDDIEYQEALNQLASCKGFAPVSPLNLSALQNTP